MPFLMMGQLEYGMIGEFLLGRQPSARAEAMGRAYASMDGDLSSVYFNPAGISTLHGLELDLSLASPYFYADEAKFYFASAGFKTSKYFTFAATFHQLSLGELTLIDETGNPYGQATPRMSDYKLSLASEPLDQFYVGLSFNLLRLTPQSIGNSSDAGYFDLGFLKKFMLAEKDKTKHSIQVGASVINLNSESMEFEGNSSGAFAQTGPFSEKIPVIARFGAQYKMVYSPARPDSLQLLACIFNTEVEDLWDSKSNTALKGGLEVKILEVIALRAGYYTQSVYDYGFPEENYDRISDFTYGIGLEIPLQKLTHHKIPMEICFDYTSLPHVKYSVEGIPFLPPPGNFKSMSLRMTWNPWNK
jgi:hypothetical protein